MYVAYVVYLMFNHRLNVYNHSKMTINAGRES